MKPTLLLGLVLAVPALAGEEAAAFTVLKVVQGDDVDFKVVPAKEASAEKSRITKEAAAALADWEKKRDAFQADKANRKKRFREPKPEPAAVSKARDGFVTQEEAQTWASEEKTKAEGKYAVIRIVDTDKSVSVQTILQKKIKGRERELQDKYDGEKEAYEAKRDAFYSNPSNLGNTNNRFTEPLPEKPKLTRIKENLPDRDTAEKAKLEFEQTEPKK